MSLPPLHGSSPSSSPSLFSSFYSLNGRDQSSYRSALTAATNGTTHSGDETLVCGGTFSLQTEDPFYASNPGRAVGKLFFVRDKKKYVCSGSVAEGNFIWTASHCVYDGENYSQNVSTVITLAVILLGKNRHSLAF